MTIPSPIRRRGRTPITPPARTSWGFLVAGYVALLPYQFEVGHRMNFAPADCFLVLVLVLAAGQLKFRKPAWTIWHFGIVLIFAARLAGGRTAVR